MIMIPRVEAGAALRLAHSGSCAYARTLDGHEGLVRSSIQPLSNGHQKRCAVKPVRTDQLGLRLSVPQLISASQYNQ